jgi:protein TonB
MILSNNRHKLLSGAAALGVQAGLLGLLLYGLAVDRTIRPNDETQLVTVATVPEPPKARPVPIHREPMRRVKEKSAPPNLKATEIAPPPPIVPQPVPPPVVTAPVASTGISSRAGAALRAGSGTGAGGTGNGLGGGGNGKGDGDPEQIAGELSAADLPRDLIPTNFKGVLTINYEVVVRYLITAKGRVDQCQTERSSGNGELDAITCSLIQKRFRFRPATDNLGHPVAVHMLHETFHWGVNEEDEQPRAGPDPRRQRDR